MKRSGPDSISSWIVAVACCFINMMMFGMTRLAGILFLASMPRFLVDRKQAAFPYTFANFIRNTSGPLVGYLGGKLGVRLVTTFGCLLAAVGVGTCFLAENIDMITVLFGSMFGFGFGLGSILLPVSINQYFDKHRATASGISFSGACLGSFVLPPIVEILLDVFGLSGTFLILSGLILNCVPAALLLRKPDFRIKSSKPQQKKDIQGKETQSLTSGKKVKLYTVQDSTLALPEQHSKNLQCESLTNNDSTNLPTSYYNLSYEERIKRLSTQTLLSTYSVRMSDPDQLDIDQILENSKGRRQVDQDIVNDEVSSFNSNTTDQDSVFGHDNQTSFPVNVTCKTTFRNSSCPLFTRKVSTDCENTLGKDNVSYQFSKSYSDLYVNGSNQKCNNDEFQNYAVRVHQTSNCPSSTGQSKLTSSAFSIISDPLFLLVAITNALYCFTFVCMSTVIVDFARDINVGYTNEKYILMSLSVGDLLGRLSFGWITDRGYMTKYSFAAVCFLCQGITTTAIAWSTGFPILVSLVALYGLSEAGLIVIFPLIVAEYIEEDKQTVAISSSHFLAGPLCLTVAPLIGFFRDENGSYVYIFIGIGIISVLCCIACLLTPYVIKCRKSTRRN